MKVKVGNSARKLVLLKLADNANDNGVCWPSIKNIAEQCEVSKRTAISHLNWLVKEGYITKQYRKVDDCLNKSNMYQLHLGGSEIISPPSEIVALGGSEIVAPRTYQLRTNKGNIELPIPEFLTYEDVDDYFEHRKSIKSPLTEVAYKRLINKLKKAHDRGFDVSSMINESITNGWKGVFEPKDKKPSGFREFG